MFKSKADIKRNMENSERPYSKLQIFDRLYQEWPPAATGELVDFHTVSAVKADLPSEAINNCLVSQVTRVHKIRLRFFHDEANNKIRKVSLYLQGLLTEIQQ